jgi:phosphate transport system substrate-binding protein
VLPSVEAVSQGAYRTLSRPVLLYVSMRALERPEVAQFAEFYISHAARFAREQGYVPLPAALYSKGLASVRGRSKGSVWEGAVPAGLTLEALQQKYGA